LKNRLILEGWIAYKPPVRETDAAVRRYVNLVHPVALRKLDKHSPVSVLADGFRRLIQPFTIHRRILNRQAATDNILPNPAELSSVSM
jgi:hypothetical protein